MAGRNCVIAIPVKDEAQHLPTCLAALAAQRVANPLTVVLLINNSSDASATIARQWASRLRVVVEEVELPRDEANAAGARRRAMDLAAGLAGENGLLFSSDADSQVAPDWLAANLRALDAGADAVAGRIMIDPRDEAGIPPALIEADAKECRFAALLDELAAVIDPDPHDPWPRHDQHSGASIAVTLAAFRRAGGIPRMVHGEDRAFFEALRRIDARIRHSEAVRVVVSGRVEGRAEGGMADTIRRRLVCPDMFLDDRLEPAQDAARRSVLRRCARRLWAEQRGAPEAFAAALQLSRVRVNEHLAAATFGAVWQALEGCSPVLQRKRVAAAAVLHEIAVARALFAEAAWQDQPVRARISSR